MVSRPLTVKQARFVEEYLVDLCATNAALRAGYSPRSSKCIGHELLGKPAVALAIAAAKRRRSERTELSQDIVLQEAARVALSDPRKFYDADGNLRPIHELDDDTAAALAGIDVEQIYEGQGGDRAVVGQVRKIKRYDKVRALELLMRHMGMLTDRHEINGDLRVEIVDVGSGSQNDQDPG